MIPWRRVHRLAPFSYCGSEGRSMLLRMVRVNESLSPFVFLLLHFSVQCLHDGPDFIQCLQNHPIVSLWHVVRGEVKPFVSLRLIHVAFSIPALFL